MFTGLIETTAEIIGRDINKLRLRPAKAFEDLIRGESIAVNGACLTLESCAADGILEFHTLEETLTRTNLGSIKLGGLVNLERALRVGARLGGHFVSGHIDTTAEFLGMRKQGDDIEYRLFVRPAKAENTALKEVLTENGGRFPKLVLGFGMEFPTNRMLRYIGKGANTDEVLEFLRICHENKIHINANFILGWDNLIEDDIQELENFMDSMPDNSITTFQMRWLFAHPHTKLHDTYKGKAVKLGPFYEGFRTEISEKQIQLNKEARDIISQYSSIKHYKLEGMTNIRKHLEIN